MKRKSLWELTINSKSSSAGNVESMVTNLAIGDALKIKMKNLKIIRKRKDMNKTIKNSMVCATIAVQKGVSVRIVRHRKTAIIKILRKWKEPLTEMRMI